jgi:hypothetical protein
MLLFDVLIFAMTVYKSTKRSRGGDRTLINILLRDGTRQISFFPLMNVNNISGAIYFG